MLQKGLVQYRLLTRIFRIIRMFLIHTKTKKNIKSFFFFFETFKINKLILIYFAVPNLRIAVSFFIQILQIYATVAAVLK